MSTISDNTDWTNGSLLLEALNDADKALLKPHHRLMQLKAGDVLYEPGDDVQHAYFPVGPTLISYMVPLDDARGVETALIGREGAVGGIVSHGHLPAYCRTVVQFTGAAIRIACSDIQQAKNASPSLHHFFTRYADCLLAQIFQSTACNASHTIEQRMAKWLLAALDRTQEQVLPLTQEQIAGMLGVGRSYVSRIMGSFKDAGTLNILRGKLYIHNREALKKLSCNCNGMVHSHFETVLAGIYPTEADTQNQTTKSH